MKYAKKIPPTDKELSAKLVAAGWNKIKEPNNLLTAILISIPLMIINVFISILVIMFFYNPFSSILSNESFLFEFTINIEALGYIVMILIFVLVHELIHAIFIPNFIKSNNIYWGITVYGGFVSTTEKIAKNRFILISVAPFFILSIIIPVILGKYNMMNQFIVFPIIVNAMGSSVDFLNALLIFFQTSKKSYIINNGLETYFKEDISQN